MIPLTFSLQQLNTRKIPHMVGECHHICFHPSKSLIFPQAPLRASHSLLFSLFFQNHVLNRDCLIGKRSRSRKVALFGQEAIYAQMKIATSIPRGVERMQKLEGWQTFRRKGGSVTQIGNSISL